MITQQTGHKSMTVLRRYIRGGELFRQNAAAAVGQRTGGPCMRGHAAEG